MQLISSSKQIGVILTARRKHLKLTQTDVATRLALSQNRISELEAKPETLTAEQLLTLLHVLGLQMALGERAGGKPKVDW